MTGLFCLVALAVVLAGSGKGELRKAEMTKEPVEVTALDLSEWMPRPGNPVAMHEWRWMNSGFEESFMLVEEE